MQRAEPIRRPVRFDADTLRRAQLRKVAHANTPFGRAMRAMRKALWVGVVCLALTGRHSAFLDPLEAFPDELRPLLVRPAEPLREWLETRFQRSSRTRLLEYLSSNHFQCDHFQTRVTGLLEDHCRVLIPGGLEHTMVNVSFYSEAGEVGTIETSMMSDITLP